jgi:hypothetical protein
MSMTMYDFVQGGGVVKTATGHYVNNIVLLGTSGNTYPITGNVQWSSHYSTPFAWDINGVSSDPVNSPDLYLVPMATFGRYLVKSNTTFATSNSYSEWSGKYNKFYST